MCIIWASKAQILGSQIVLNCGLRSFSQSFQWFHISIVSHAHFNYFYMSIDYGPQRLNFWTIFGPKISKNSSLWSFSQKVFTAFTSVLLHMLIATLGPKIGQNTGLWSFSKNNFHWFPISLGFNISLTTFRGVLNIGLRDPISRSFWVLKWFRIILVLHAHWEHLSVF